MRRRRTPVACALIAVAALGCPAPETPLSADLAATVAAPVWTESAQRTGLTLQHRNGMSGERYLVEVMGGGAALFDHDGDGDLDVAVTRGGPLRGDGGGGGVALFRNDLANGVPRFVDVSAAAGLDGDGYAMGLAVGDADGDGHLDLYVSAFGPNRLWRNRGDGSFEDVGTAAGIADPGLSVTATWFDADLDGDLDLYVGNYLRFRFEDHRRCPSASGYEDYCGPLVYPAQANPLYLNRGDGTFDEGSGPAGLDLEPRYTLGLLAIDANGDDRLDLYEANDGQPNRLWLAGADGRFDDQAVLAGCAVNGDGRPEASMGIAAGDHDDDGDEDLLLTHRNQESHTLYRALGGGAFDDATRRAGLGDAGWERTGFGVALLDGDGDGVLDLLVANGAVISREVLLAAGDPYPLHEPNDYMAGAGGGRFRSPVDPTGQGLSEVTRGLAWGDIDNDGDPDVVLVNNNGTLRLLLGSWPAGTRWVGYRLGGHANGARVCLIGGPAASCRWSHRDGSYASSSDPRVRFAGAAAAGAVEVEVRWPDGLLERFDAGAPGRYHDLRRGAGRS